MVTRMIKANGGNKTKGMVTRTMYGNCSNSIFTDITVELYNPYLNIAHMNITLTTTIT